MAVECVLSVVHTVHMYTHSRYITHGYRTAKPSDKPPSYHVYTRKEVQDKCTRILLSQKKNIAVAAKVVTTLWCLYHTWNVL